jgi:hypothetical protein
LILSQTEKRAISSIGWVDKCSLWILDTGSEEIELIETGNCEYHSVHRGERDYFALLHHQPDHGYPTLTAHTADDPSRICARIVFGDESRFEGDRGVWKYLPQSYVDYFRQNATADHWLITIESETGTTQYQNFDWFDESYDHGYQAIIGVMEIPVSHLVLISVQRSSDLVLYDPIEKRIVRKVSLAGGYGNPVPRFSRKRNEVWCVDYDTIVKLDPRDWTVIGRRIIQEEEGNVRQFAGEFDFDRDESTIAIARPFSGDVLRIDMNTLETMSRCETGGQPLDVTVVGNHRVFARNWKDGGLLKGEFKK